MKIFVSYIKTNVLWVVFCAVLILFQMVFMRLSGMKQNDCIYGIILESMVFIVVFFIGFINYLIKYNKLKRTSMLDIDEQVGYGMKASSNKTDIYAVGILLNVMLTGKFPKEKPAQGKLWNVIERCISLDANSRYRADELIERLDNYLGENTNAGKKDR